MYAFLFAAAPSLIMKYWNKSSFHSGRSLVIVDKVILRVPQFQAHLKHYSLSSVHWFLPDSQTEKKKARSSQPQTYCIWLVVQSHWARVQSEWTILDHVPVTVTWPWNFAAWNKTQKLTMINQLEAAPSQLTENKHTKKSNRSSPDDKGQNRKNFLLSQLQVEAIWSSSGYY